MMEKVSLCRPLLSFPHGTFILLSSMIACENIRFSSLFVASPAAKREEKRMFSQATSMTALAMTTIFSLQKLILSSIVNCLTNNIVLYYQKPETHKGLKRVTRFQCLWIFILTIFGNLSDGYPFSTKWLLSDHHADVLRQEFCISRLKITPYGFLILLKSVTVKWFSNHFVFHLFLHVKRQTRFQV